MRGRTQSKVAYLLARLDGLQEANDHLRTEVDMERMCIRMAVHRLGGMVEGAPTHAGNFLQRIDALVAAEAERDAALRERDEIHRVAASRAGRDINAEVIAKQAAESAALRSRLEECERQRDAAVKAGAAMSEARETLENVLVSKHGGEPIALLAELDEARSRLKDTQDAARWFLPAIEDTFKNLSPAHGAAEVREFGTRLAILRGALSASDPKEGAR